MPNKAVPIFRHGRTAGYDPATRHYHAIDGTMFKSRRAFEQSNGVAGGAGTGGGYVQAPSLHPRSDMLGQLERVVMRAQKGEDVSNDPALKRAGANFNRLLSAVQPYKPKQTKPIPSEVRASMRMADFYDRRYGDLHRHIETPITVACGSELKVQSGDPGWKKFIEDTYARIDMWTALWRGWMGAAQYGVAFPYEVWDDGSKTLLQILDLPPAYVWVGYAMSFGTIVDDNYALLPINDEDTWSKKALSTYAMPMSFNRMGVGENENLVDGWNIPLSGARLQPIRAMSYGYERYPVVPISRAFMGLGTRMVFDELTRATLEGHMNQLWVFTIGSDAHPADVIDMGALQAALGAASGEHTGYFTWDHTLKVDVKAPKSIEQMLAPETRQGLTLDMFRDLGGNIRIETGNPLIGQRETAADNVDLSMWLRQLEFPRRVVMQWERYIRAKLAEAEGPAAVKANETTTVAHSRSLLEVATIIEKELMPLYKMGKLSNRTLLTEAGRSYEQELNNKREEEADAYLFGAPSTYVQETVSPDTAPSKSTTSPQGRPDNNSAAAFLTAAWADDGLRVAMLQSMVDSITQLAADRDAGAFIASLKELTSTYLPQVTQQAYNATGGRQIWAGGDVLTYASTFVNGFADRFGEQLTAALADPAVDPMTYMARALMYPIEGYKMAVINGQRLAMAEKGAKYWHRKTNSMACELCQADAKVAHPISEPFTLLHPNESVAGEELSVIYDTGTGKSTVHLPVPSYHDEVTDALRAASGSDSHYTRRARV